MNEIRFKTNKREMHHCTQNNGIVVHGNHQEEPADFYGVLQDILELQYIDWHKVYLFKSDW